LQSNQGLLFVSRNKVSQFADKEVKKLLHLGAMSAIRLDNAFRKYYLRKLGERKNKMSVLNAVRKKMVRTIYALIRKKKHSKIWNCHRNRKDTQK